MIDVNAILERYGPRVFFPAITFVAVAAWALSHFAAGPGGEVSVLFGLFGYTRSHTEGGSGNKEQETQHQPAPPPPVKGFDPPLEPVEENAREFDLSGEWVFQVNGTARLDSSGHKRNGHWDTEIAMVFSEDGGNVKGEYLWATGNSCSKATVLGTRVGPKFELKLLYKGGCCGGAKMDFSGRLLSANAIEGNFEPDGIPPRASNNCNIWWAGIIGSRGT